MLDKNPGLREISPSITGGSVGAQGYWMPYRCARAVCATFCFEIADALIPLFGPGFPSECTRPESQFFWEMVINHQLVMEATIEANASRHAYGMRTMTALNGPASQARLEGTASARTTRVPACGPRQPGWAGTLRARRARTALGSAARRDSRRAPGMARTTPRRRLVPSAAAAPVPRGSRGRQCDTGPARSDQRGVEGSGLSLQSHTPDGV